MSLEDLDEQIGEKSSKKKYLTWGIIAIIIIAAIAIPVACMRQSEPTEPAEPTTIEQLETEIDALTDTVGGLETKIALHAEDIANFVAGDCTCPDYSGQFQNINNDLILLRTDLNDIPDYAVNFTQVNTELDALSTSLTAVEATLLVLQEKVEAIEGTDWGPDITSLKTGLVNANTGITGLGEQFVGLDNDLSDAMIDIATLNGQVIDLQTSIEDLQYYVDLLFIAMPSYSAVVTNMDNGYLDVEVNGGGNYPVVVTLYGLGLDSIGVRVIDGAGYDIIDRMLYAQNKIFALFIEPDYSWEMTDMITLVIMGSISYATASVGA